MAINKLEVLAIIKQLVGLDPTGTEHDGLITLYMDIIGQRILNYVHHSSMPDGLKYTWAAMTAAALQAEQMVVLFPPDPDDAEAYEVSLGDTTVKPIKPVAKPITGPTLTVQDAVLFDYQSELNGFRRMRW
ncbi:hypothetical protein [Cohnella sp. GCM10012308]|uniref:hypothetical protein n=1 Tax=Cohnella sp. GCM10012308 TaxID=3317329 RepID=UPI00360B9A48